MRLMNEVYKVSQLYLDIAQVMDEDFDCEIHLDINPSENHGSSCVINEAVGYVRALTNVVPMVKPNGFAATHCADRLKALKIKNHLFIKVMCQKKKNKFMTKVPTIS